MAIFGSDPALTSLLLYVLAFGAAGAASFLSVLKARTIVDPDARRGLVSLLLLSGGWAASHVGYLLSPTDATQIAFYVVGLAVGFAATGAWLYFCSAYTGRTLHRNPSIRRIAIALYVGVVALKVTNPIHGLYFTTAHVSTPFTHLAVTHGTLHWLAMGLSYMLAGIGYFMLVERFGAVGQDARPLVVLVGLTGLPVAFDIASQLTPGLLDMTYEPLGVSVFAVGVLYLYFEEFQAVQLAGRDDRPTLLLDEDDRIREYNATARELFPGLSGGIGERLSSVVPAIAEALERETGTFMLERDGERYFYRVTRTPITAGDVSLGSLCTIEDVTEAEESRRDLERERERLDQFASVVAHDLRNPLNVADGRLELGRTRYEDDEDLEAAAEAIERMETLIDDLLALARQGRDIDDPEQVELDEAMRECWSSVETVDASLSVAGEATIVADPERLAQLLENLVRNAVEHAGEDVAITVGPLEEGFYVADDGPGVPAEDRADVFEAGFTTNPEGTGFGLPIVKQIVDAHGWSIELVEAEGGGARFEITDVERIE